MPCLSLGNHRRVAWSMWFGSVTEAGADLVGAGFGVAAGFMFATAIRVLGGSGVVVLTGRYAGLTSALAWGSGLGLGNGLGAAAWGMRLALRANDFAFLATWDLSVAAGLLVMCCWVARCCW